MTFPDPELMTVKEAADEIEVHRQQIDRWIRSNLLPVVQRVTIGGLKLRLVERDRVLRLKRYKPGPGPLPEDLKEKIVRPKKTPMIKKKP